MKTRAILSFCLFAATSSVLFAGWSSQSRAAVAYSENIDRLTSLGRAEYVDPWTLQIDYTVRINGQHDLPPFGGRSIVQTGPYSGSLTGSPTNASTRYTTTLQVVAQQEIPFCVGCWQNLATGSWSDSVTTPPPPVRPVGSPPPIQPLTDGSPIILNLSPGGYELSGVDDPVSFDILATGTPIRISWTARGSQMAFLALDRNGNGIIDDGAELFGNHTPLASGNSAGNGFEALKEQDTNRDGQVDAADAGWTRLLLWVDLNHNGVSETDELTPIASSNVVALSLDYHFSGKHDRFGNQFRFAAKLVLRDKKDDGSRKYYDIYFVRVP